MPNYYATVSTGSNTTVKSGYGRLKSVTVTPAAQTQVHIVDSVSIGTNPPLISAVTGDILWLGPFVDAEPEYFGPFDIGFNAGLTVAATSNARVHVEYE
jgi:hypothetical protein